MFRKSHRGMAIILVVALLVGMMPAMAFATEEPTDTIHLVGVGDSMSQGYQFLDYNEDFSETQADNHYCGWQGASERNYMQLLEEELKYKNGNVEKTDLSIQGMQPDELLKILDWNSIPDSELSDGAVKHLNWWIRDYTLPDDRKDNPALGKQGQEPNIPYVFETKEEMNYRFKSAIESADILVYDIGMNYFGTSLTDRVWGSESNERHFTDLMKSCDGKTKTYIENLRSKVEQFLKTNGLGTLDELADGMLYAYASYIYYTNKCLEKIYSLNSNVQVIVVGLYNPHPDLYLTIDDVEVCFSDMIDMSMSSLNTYMTTLSPYSGRFMFADLPTAPMSFADELKYHPGKESADLKSLLKKQYNTLIAKDSDYFEGLETLVYDNPNLMNYLEAPVPTNRDEFNNIFGAMGMSIPYKVGEWEDTVKRNLYERYDVGDPEANFFLYPAIETLAYEVADHFSVDFMESVVRGEREDINFVLPNLTSFLIEIYQDQNNREILEKTAYQEEEALEVYRRALKERTFDVKEFYSMLSANGSGYDINTSRPFLDPENEKTEDYHMIHYQVRFNGEGAARGFGVHPSPEGIHVKSKAIERAYTDNRKAKEQALTRLITRAQDLVKSGKIKEALSDIVEITKKIVEIPAVSKTIENSYEQLLEGVRTYVVKKKWVNDEESQKLKSEIDDVIKAVFNHDGNLVKVRVAKFINTTLNIAGDRISGKIRKDLEAFTKTYVVPTVRTGAVIAGTTVAAVATVKTVSKLVVKAKKAEAERKAAEDAKKAEEAAKEAARLLEEARTNAVQAIKEAAGDNTADIVKSFCDNGYDAINSAKTADEIMAATVESVNLITEAKTVLETKLSQNKLKAYKNGKIKVSFENPAIEGAVNYKVVRSTKKDFSKNLKTYTVKVKDQDTLTLTNAKNLKKGTKYYYRVKANVKLSDGSVISTDWSNTRSAVCKKTIK